MHASVAILAQAVYPSSPSQALPHVLRWAMAMKAAVAASRGAVLALHSSAGLAGGSSREACRLLRAAEGLCRAAVATLEAAARPRSPAPPPAADSEAPRRSGRPRGSRRSARPACTSVAAAAPLKEAADGMVVEEPLAPSALPAPPGGDAVQSACTLPHAVSTTARQVANALEYSFMSQAWFHYVPSRARAMVQGLAIIGVPQRFVEPVLARHPPQA